MPTKEQQRHKLINLLKKLFQLDQPDLDFGFYRVMHAKAKQITEFLDKDLLVVMEDAFGEVGENKKAQLKVEYEDALKTAKEYGSADPENAPKVMEARAKYEAAMQTSDSEGEIYDHLYRFFERYYDNGDFISRRYYTRETSGKAAPFAIPYNGEEVKLVWANMDQYYIKTSEYFSNYTFDIMQAQEVQTLLKEDSLGLFKDGEEKPRRVHFRIVEATEGEHGNVKASETEKRYFIINKDQPAHIDENGELVVNFEYRPDPEKSGQEGTWRERRNAEAVGTVLNALDNLNGAKEYRTFLKIPAPTEKQKDRPLLAKYINQYTARNTMDYFIHKDLGGFLRREMDFYIKNEVMRLDDIENAEAPAVESYLAKIKVLRTIAGKLIDFLAQLEDFQKKLWLKKKFVVETNYCITLDRVPEALYPEIAANEAQHNEWIKLFAIDEIQATNGDLFNGGNPGYIKPLTVEFLKANKKLVLDTQFFDEKFKAKLLASIENLDEQRDGLLIHSENYQVLKLLQERYREQVKCIYIDPPYNTGEDGFVYKDSYKHSTWMAMISDRLKICLPLMGEANMLFCSIDRDEDRNLLPLFFEIIGEDGFIEEIIWQKAYGGGSKTKHINNLHEYIICFSSSKGSLPFLRLSPDPEVLKYYKFEDSKIKTRGMYRLQPLYSNSNAYRENLTYPIPIPNADPSDSDGWNSEWLVIRNMLKTGKLTLQKYEKSWKFLHITDDGQSEAWEGKTILPTKQWQWKWERTCKAIINDEIVIERRKDQWSVNYKQYRYDEQGEERGKKPPSILIGPYTQSGTDEIKNLFGFEAIKFPKPSILLQQILGIDYKVKNAIFLDHFAGSGTTGDTVINLNRKDGGNRKYILAEMGDYFDTVLKPRIAKVIYSENWKNGKPTAHDTGISHFFKYIRLESYEDALNNLRFEENHARDSAIKENEDLHEDYMLHYLLDIETNGSQSLLNIDAFADPTAYTLNVKKPGSDEYYACNVDLMETFNYLIGLRVTYIDVPQSFTANFKREIDSEIPEDQETRLVVDGRIKQNENGLWWFRKVEGWVPGDAANPNNGKKEKVLIVWRKLTDDMEKDNVMLDEWFTRNRISTKDFEFDTIYVNGSNNLPNLKLEDDNWKVRLIEEEFMKRMWDVEEV